MSESKIKFVGNTKFISPKMTLAEININQLIPYLNLTKEEKIQMFNLFDKASKNSNEFNRFTGKDGKTYISIKTKQIKDWIALNDYIKSDKTAETAETTEEEEDDVPF